jgi:hypothetical protein
MAYRSLLPVPPPVAGRQPFCWHLLAAQYAEDACSDGRDEDPSGGDEAVRQPALWALRVVELRMPRLTRRASRSTARTAWTGGARGNPSAVGATMALARGIVAGEARVAHERASHNPPVIAARLICISDGGHTTSVFPTPGSSPRSSTGFPTRPGSTPGTAATPRWGRAAAPAGVARARLVSRLWSRVPPTEQAEAPRSGGCLLSCQDGCARRRSAELGWAPAGVRTGWLMRPLISAACSGSAFGALRARLSSWAVSKRSG